MDISFDFLDFDTKIGGNRLPNEITTFFSAACVWILEEYAIVNEWSFAYFYSEGTQNNISQNVNKGSTNLIKGF